jgi:hypothetical protein
MTALEHIALIWLECRNEWLDLGLGTRNFSNGERDTIITNMGIAERNLQCEAQKLKQSMVDA